MKPKKVTYIVTKSVLGGAGKYVLGLAKHAKELGYDTTIIAGPTDSGSTGPLLESANAFEIRTRMVPSLGRDIFLLNDLRAFFFLLSYFMKEKPPTVHLNSPKAGGLGALAARIAGVHTIIYTAHGWSFFEDVGTLQKIFRKIASWATNLLSTHVIAVSKKDAGAFRRWLGMKKKILYIPNGIASSDFSKEDAKRILTEHGIQSEKPIIGTIAELHKNKGLTYLIAATETVPEAQCVIVGEGEERKNLAKSIQEKNLTDRVFLLGYIPEAEKLLPAFDVFVLPSVKEGLPYVLLEAGAQSLPIVATRVGGIPDVIEHEKNGLLVELKDASALSDALNILIQNPNLAQRYGEALAIRITKDYSLSKTIEATFDLYSFGS